MTNTQQLAIEILVNGDWRTVPVDRFPTIEAAQAEIAAAIADCEGQTFRVDTALFKVMNGALYRWMNRRVGFQVVTQS